MFNSINRSLSILRSIRIAQGFSLLLPVIMVFYQSNGLTVADGITLQSFFAVVTICCEIPTGTFADRYGRKNSIIIGWLIQCIGFGVYSIGHTFWSFLWAESLLGIGISFVSGADRALLSKLLEARQRQAAYLRIDGLYHCFGTFAKAIACILGGCLAKFSIRLPLIIDSVLMVCFLPALFFIIESKRFDEKKEAKGMKEIWQILKRLYMDQPKVLWLIALYASIGSSTMVMSWLIQPFIQFHGISVEWFGVIYACLHGVGAMFSWNVHRLEVRVGRDRMYLIMILLPVVGYIVMGLFNTLWSTILFSSSTIVYGISGSIVSDSIRDMIDDRYRARVLSINNAGWKLLFAVVGVLVAKIIELNSIRAAMIFAAIFFLLMGLGCFKKYLEY